MKLIPQIIGSVLSFLHDNRDKGYTLTELHNELQYAEPYLETILGALRYENIIDARDVEDITYYTLYDNVELKDNCFQIPYRQLE